MAEGALAASRGPRVVGVAGITLGITGVLLGEVRGRVVAL